MAAKVKTTTVKNIPMTMTPFNKGMGKVCASCGGSGRKGGKACASCGGTGKK